jgi:hypothetical protein
MVLACPTFDAIQEPAELFQWIMNSNFSLKVAQNGSPDQVSSNPLNSCSQYLLYAFSPAASTYSCIHSHTIRDLSSPKFLPFGVYHAYVDSLMAQQSHLRELEGVLNLLQLFVISCARHSYWSPKSLYNSFISPPDHRISNIELHRVTKTISSAWLTDSPSVA